MKSKSTTRKVVDREWTVAELTTDPNFPFNSRSSIFELIREGRLKVVRYSPKKIRILQSEIDRFFREMKKK